MAAAADILSFPQIRGGSFDESQDGERLRAQHEAIWEVMIEGGWHTLDSLQHELFARFGIQAKTTGISARIRDFRKDECGKHTVFEERVEGHPTLWQFKLEANPNAAQEVERYKRMNVGGKDSVLHDTQIVDVIVDRFSASIENIHERPMHLKAFIAQLRDRLLPIAEAHMLALWDEADRRSQSEPVANEPRLDFSPEI